MTNEEARDGQVAGNDQNTTIQEREPIVNSLTDTKDIREAVRSLFDEIAACPVDSYVILTSEDPFFAEAQPVRIKPTAELGGLQVGEFVHLAPIYDADGRKLEEPGDEWWAKALAGVKHDTWVSWVRTPNAVLRLGEVFAVSLGEYQFAQTLTVDGVEVAELITLDEIKRREQARKDAWIAQQAEAIEAAKPAEAATVDVWDFDPRGDRHGILYVREVGPVSISWPAEAVDGVVHLKGGPEIMVHVGMTSEIVPGVEEMRELASALMAAIPVVEAATA